MTILSSGHSDIGMKRSTNQDSICLYPEANFFAVADGMGGHNGGDIASQMSVKILPEFISKNIKSKAVPELMAESIKFVNKSIFDHGQKNAELKGMGTTITAIMFNANEINIANVGDSRTYLVSNNKLYQLTRDHSLVQEKLNIGLYDREAAKADPHKNVLIRTVGFEEELEVDVFHYKIQKNDMFMLCSDGLHGKVSDEDIIHIFNKNIKTPEESTQENLDATVHELIAQANANGGQDNISVIIAIAK